MMHWKKPFQGRPSSPESPAEASNSCAGKNAVTAALLPARDAPSSSRTLKWLQALRSCCTAPSVLDEDLYSLQKPAARLGKLDTTKTSSKTSSPEDSLRSKGQQHLSRYSSAISIHADVGGTNSARVPCTTRSATASIPAKDRVCAELPCSVDDIDVENRSSYSSDYSTSSRSSPVLVVTAAATEAASQAKLADLQHALEQAVKLNQQLLEEADGAAAVLKSTQQALTNQATDADNVTHQLHELKAAHKQLQQDLATAEAEKNQMQSSAYGLNNQVLQLKKQAERKAAAAEQKQNAMQTELDTCRKQLQQAREECNTRAAASAVLRTKYEMLIGSSSQLEQEHQQLQVQHAELQAEASQKQSRIDNLTQKVADAKLALLQHNRAEAAQNAIIAELQQDKQRLQSAADAASRVDAAQKAEIDQLQELVINLSDGHLPDLATTRIPPCNDQGLEAVVRQSYRQGRLLYLKGYPAFCKQNNLAPGSQEAALQFLGQVPLLDPSLVFVYARYLHEGKLPIDSGAYGAIYDEGATVLKAMEVDGYRLADIKDELTVIAGVWDPSLEAQGLVRTITLCATEHSVPGKYLVLTRMEKANEGCMWDVVTKMAAPEDIPTFRSQLYAILYSMYEAAQGLLHMHRKGTIHVDLKNSNVLVNTDASGVRGKVADFSLAKVLQAGQEGFEDMRVTPFYAPPEMPAGEGPISKATDVHMMGDAICEAVFFVVKGKVFADELKRREQYREWMSRIALGEFDELLPMYARRLLWFINERMMGGEVRARASMKEAVAFISAALVEAQHS